MQRAKLHLVNLWDGTQPPVMWTDKKFFSVTAVEIHKIYLIYTLSKCDILLNNRLFFFLGGGGSKSIFVMVWAGVTSTEEKILLINEGQVNVS